VAHSLSAKKRVRQNAKARVRNRARKSVIKTQVKRFEEALSTGNVETTQDQLKQLTRKIDRLSTTSTIHKNTAARIKSRMTRRANAQKAKVS